MANTKQARKMIRKIRRRTSHNRWWRRRIKTAIKELDEIIAKPQQSDKALQESYSKLQKTVDKASKEGVIHKNKGNRIKSRIIKKITKSSS